MTFQPVAALPVDAELWATDYLRRFLSGRAETHAQSVYVGNRKPPTNRPRIVTVRRDGGPQQGLFDNPRLTIRIWADDLDEAADLARLVVAAINGSPGDGPVVAVNDMSGPSPIPDDSQAQQVVNAELRTRCTVI